MSITEAASELGIRRGQEPARAPASTAGRSTSEVVTRMLDDGLLLEINGRLVASPHPGLKKIGE